MIEDIPSTGPAFNVFGLNRPAAHSTHAAEGERTAKSAALIINLQSFDGMSREDALAFSKALGQQVTEFRQKGIEPVWVSIAAGGSKLLQPLTDNRDAQNRDLLVLEEMGFTGHQSKFSNSDIYAAFINEFGPRDNEAVYRKPSMSALVTPADVLERDTILKWAGTKLESQRSEEDHPETRYIQPGEQDTVFASFFPEAITLHDYLKAQKITDTNILGTVSQYCVTETAISSATKGYKTHINDGLVLSWQYPVTGASRDKGILVWGKFDHQGLIKDALAAALHDPARSFSADQRAQIEAITIGGHHLAGATAAPVVSPSNSKILSKPI